MMRLITIIILSALMQVSAATFGQKVTLKGNGVTFEKVFWEIRKQTSYDVLISSTKFKTSQTINVEFKDMPLSQAMDKILQGTGLVYTIEDKNVVIKEKEPSFLERFLGSDDGAFADIRGVVRNERGEALEGITVMVKGAKTGTRTNAKGEFVLKGVKEGDVLVFTGVTIEPFEYTIKDDKNIDLNLKARLVQLEEVGINTGYQKISKERFVGSYSQLDSAAFHRRAGMGILERLDGTINGMVFNKKSTSFPIQIRGLSTLSTASQEPLIVLDNFPMDSRFRLENLNPNDVENITVLKDAAAAAIWGARAGNGVIVITTKKGKFNQPLHISMSSNLTLEDKPDLLHFDRLSSKEFIEVEQMLFSKGFYNSNINNRTTRPVISNVVEILARRRLGLISSIDSANQIETLQNIDVRNDLNNHIYRNSFKQQQYLNLSGGSNILSYNLALGYNQNLNNVKGSKSDKLHTVSTNAVYRPFKGLDIQTGLNYSYGIQKSAALPLLANLSPYNKFINDAGEFLAIPFQYRQGYLDTVGNGKLLDWDYRPLEEIRLINNIGVSHFVQANLKASYELFSGLKLNLEYRHVNQTSNNKNLKSLDTYEVRNLVNRFTNAGATTSYLQYPVPKGGILELSNLTSNRFDLRGGINYSNSWREKHQLTAILQAEISEAKGYLSSERLYGYDDNYGTYNLLIDYSNSYPVLYGAASGVRQTIPTGSLYRENPLNRYVSVLGNISYSLLNRYTLFGSFRRDATNLFGVNTNNKWKPLWSTGINWDITKEKFYSISWLHSLRLRASYGYTGNVNNELSGRFTLRYVQIPNLWTGEIFASPSQAPNPELRWEQNRILNLGVDFSLFNNRLSGSIESYYKKSSDLISAYPLDPSTGVSFFPMNYANMNSRGLELQLNSVNAKGKLNWTTNSGISYNKTIIGDVYVDFDYRARDFVLYRINATPGRLAYGLSSYKWGGLDPVTGDPQGWLNGKISKDYRAIENDSVSNQIFHGSSIPLATAFLNNSFNWKGFSLSFNITGRFGFYFREPVLNIQHNGVWGANNYLSTYKQRWQKSGDELHTNVPSMPYPILSSVSGRAAFYEFAEIHVKKGDNIRMQDIRLSYQLTRNLIKKMPFQSCQFFFYPNNLNLILWRAEKSDYDPDLVNDLLNGPAPKSWTLGFNVNF